MRCWSMNLRTGDIFWVLNKQGKWRLSGRESFKLPKNLPDYEITNFLKDVHLDAEIFLGILPEGLEEILHSH